MTICIKDLSLIIASTGRREVLKATLESVFRQPFLPGQIVLVGVTPDDLPEFDQVPVETCLKFTGIKSLTSQRNHGIRALKESTRHVAFLDDDSEVHPEYFAEVQACFDKHPEVVAFSGSVMRNGQVTRKEARRLLDSHEIPTGMPNFGYLPKRWSGLYGCTMNVRRSALEKEVFDEELIRYALGEDTEFGLRLQRHGEVGGSARCVMVHLAHKAGRTSEVAVGYSQIANYYYFVRKGIGYPRGKFLRENLIGLPLRNLAGVVMEDNKSVHSVDRKGRFIGNCLALKDMCMGRLHPKRIIEIDPKPVKEVVEQNQGRKNSGI